MLDVLTVGEEVLRQKTEKIDSFGPELRLLAEAMIETMHEEDGIGLAAPQIGVSKRLFVVHLSGEEPRVFVNPEIIGTSHELSSYEEGCLSVPGVYAEVTRPKEITLQAQTLEGKSYTLEADGMLARVIQHEYDHLKGVLFVDRLDEEKRERILQIYHRKNRKRK